MTEMTGAPPARRSIGEWAGRYRTPAELIVAALLGLIVFPLVFNALLPHDVRLGEKVSLIDVVWLVLALAAAVILLRARSSLARLATSAADRLSASLPATEEPNQVSGHRSSSDHDARDRSGSVARALLDLVFLLIIQAMLRSPLVGVVSGFAPEAWVDGGYVVVVVVIALVLLVLVNRESKPLLERLIWRGLNQVVPTAGFATTRSVAATYSTQLATSTRSSHRQPVPAPPQSSPTVDAPTQALPVLEPTMLAPDAAVAATLLAPAEPTGPVQADAPTPDAPTIVAGELTRTIVVAGATMPSEPAPAPVEAAETVTLIAVEPPATSAEATQTIVSSEPRPTKPHPNDGKDDSP
jgi:hypothetical protein